MDQRKRFSRAERKEVLAAIRSFLKSGGIRRPRFISAYLTQAGVEHPNGEWTPQKVSSFLKVTPVRIRSSAQPELPAQPVPVKAKKESGSDTIALCEVVLASNLQDNQKQAVLRTLLNGGGQ